MSAATGAASAAVTAFRKRPAILIVFVVMGAAFIGQGLATAAFLGTASDLERPLRSVMVGVSLFLAGVGFWFAAQALRRLRGPEQAIVIGPAGLHDWLISDQPIPWRLIRNLRVARGTRGSSVLAFDLEGNERGGIHWWPRLVEPVNRTFGYGYYVFVMGTEANVDRLAAAVERYRPVRADAQA
jgi:hypothetical protein